MKILFLDIDGVVLPTRAYLLPDQTKPTVSVFDPCSVALLNDACKRNNWKIVVHSSWIRTNFWKIDISGPGDVIDHCIRQGINEDLFHEDWCCNRDISWRYNRINEWLSRHDEVTDFVIVDDTLCDADYVHKSHLVITDENEGITMKIYNKLSTGTFKKVINNAYSTTPITE